MAESNHWLTLFTVKTWEEFVAAGATVSGFREARWSMVRQIKPGDFLLCYLTRVSRFVAVLEVTSAPYQDWTPIWEDDIFPCRVGVQVVAQLTPETAIPIVELQDQLSIFHNLDNPHAWSGHVRGSPTRWGSEDGEIIRQAIQAAAVQPVIRPVPARLRHAALPVAAGEPVSGSQRHTRAGREVTEHDEIQWLLLKLGSDIGLSVWVARNDRGKTINGQRFTDLRGIRSDLPRQFDPDTHRTIEHIDVLWLQGNAIVAAFEIESTTSIYSGLLRMSDLIAMQPNLNIRLYIVAPDERRARVSEEVHRPTFARRTPPLRDVCQFIAFSTLRQEVARVGPYVRYLKPDFLDGLAEDCVDELGSSLV